MVWRFRIAFMTSSVFVSYSHRDENWMRRVTTHLQSIRKLTAVDIWVDTVIGAGQVWHEQLLSALNRAHAAVLVLSADFLASSFINNEEIPRVLEAESARGLTIVPVLARPCAFEQIEWLGRRQVRPRDAIALSSMADHDADSAMADLAREVAGMGAERRHAELPAPEVEQLTAAPQVRKLPSTENVGSGLLFFYLARDRIQSLFVQLPLERLRASALNSGAATRTSTADSGSALIAAAARLPPVLEEIERNRRVGDLARVIAHNLQFDFDWYLFDCPCEVKQWVSTVSHVILEGCVCEYTITISCTKSNVVGLEKEGTQWLPVSGTVFMFSGRHKIHLRGLIRIVVADRGKRQLMATPLYLTFGTALG